MVNLEQLKNAWEFTGIDVEELIEKISELLSTYNHRHSKHGIIQLLAIFIENKKPLIEMIMKSPHYNGNLQIVLEEEFDRDIDSNGIYRFINHFCSTMEVDDYILKTRDENGKTYRKMKKDALDKLPSKIKIAQIQKATTDMQQVYTVFNGKGKTRESIKRLDNFKTIIYKFMYYPCSKISEDLKDEINSIEPKLKIGEGMKTSRAFNKVCTFYGVTENPKYNTEFPRYADMVNALSRKLNYVISLNPLDYLKMSFGNTWASCHTIDKQNVRCMENAYHGQYCGGTISYMLDKVSFVNYVVHTTNASNPEELDKIYRNMFHYQSGALIQGRVYPQGKDGATDLYTKMRGIMQKQISELLNLENLWVKKGSTCDSDWIYSKGRHYHDYYNYSDCNLTIIKELQDNISIESNFITVGHEPVCVYCGEQRDLYSEYLSESNCELPLGAEN